MLELFKYQFFINAILGAVLSSITCGFIGAYIVSRRIVFISGGISHASFGGVGIAYYLGLPPLFGAAVFSILSAVGIGVLTNKFELREDSLIGMMWSFGMAVGIIFIFLTPGYAANLMSYLFGSILTISYWEIFMMIVLALIIILFFTFLFKEILFVAFDEDYARTQGIPTKIINLVLISLVALTIVLNMRVVGIILVISLLTIPQATANLFTKSFKLIIIYSTIFAFLASFLGLIFSYQLNIPSGAAIIFISIIIYLLLKGGLYIQTRVKLKNRMVNN